MKANLDKFNQLQSNQNDKFSSMSIYNHWRFGNLKIYLQQTKQMWEKVLDNAEEIIGHDPRFRQIGPSAVKYTEEQDKFLEKYEDFREDSLETTNNYLYDGIVSQVKSMREKDGLSLTEIKQELLKDMNSLGFKPMDWMDILGYFTFEAWLARNDSEFLFDVDDSEHKKLFGRNFIVSDEDMKEREIKESLGLEWEDLE
jgi:hypothetical protein